MPRGYRLIVLAAFGWLSLAAAQDHHDQGHQGQAQAKRHKGIATPTPVEPKADAANSHAAQQQCEGYDRAKTDCNSAAVQAAVEQARDADWQANAAAFGVGTGFLTLGAAFAAALYARSAVIAARQTANDARITIGPDLVVTAQLYLARSENMGSVLTLSFTNHGPTRAKHVMITECRVSCSESEYSPDLASKFFMESIVGEGGRGEITYTIDAIATPEFDVVPERLHSAFIRWIFTDAFSQDRDDCVILVGSHQNTASAVVINLSSKP